MEKLIMLEEAIGNGKVLVANSTMEVKEIMPWEEAVNLIWNNKAYILIAKSDGKKLRSPSVEWDWPVVLVLAKYEKLRNRTFELDDPVSKNCVRQRDNYTCAYCGKFGNTVDHIFPASRGGQNTWGNLVTACKRCNGFKRDRTPEEAGMKRPVIKPGNFRSHHIEKLQTLLYEALGELS